MATKLLESVSTSEQENHRHTLHYIKNKIGQIQGIYAILDEKEIPVSPFLNNQSQEVVAKLHKYIQDHSNDKDLCDYIRDFSAMHNNYVDFYKNKTTNSTLNDLLELSKESINELKEKLDEKCCTQEKKYNPTPVSLIEKKLQEYLTGLSVEMAMTETDEIVTMNINDLDFILSNICSNIKKYQDGQPIIIVGHNHTKHKYAHQQEELDSYVINVLNGIKPNANKQTSNGIGLEGVHQKAKQGNFEFASWPQEEDKIYVNQLTVPVYSIEDKVA